MTDFNKSIPAVVAGDDIDIKRTVLNVPAGQTLVEAWITFKAKITDADPGLVQKVITPNPVSGIGQIIDTGASGTGALLFQLTGADTLALPTGSPTPYDIKVRTSAGKIYTAEQGVYLGSPRITTAIA
jgi:hypothetical protein